MTRRILALYLEPAPYILSLIAKLRIVPQFQIDVLLVSPSLTQKWSADLGTQAAEYLPSSTFQASGEIWNRLKQGRYDLLHLAGWGHPLLLTALLFAKMLNIPVTMESDTQHVVNDRKNVTLELTALIKHFVYPWLFSFPKMFLPGGSRQAAYLHRYGVPQARIAIANMTSDIEAITNYRSCLTDAGRDLILSDYRIAADDVCFLYLGRLEPHKGIEDLLEAFSRLKLDIANAVLIIAGDGSLRHLVIKMAATSSAIRYLGQLSGDHVWRAYCLANIFVIPSRNEPWGLVVNEAMAAGLPIIATNEVGCVDDLVYHGKNGFVVPSQSPERLKEAMLLLAGNVAIRQRMGKESARIVSNWTMEHQAENVAAAWHKVLS